ncbi:MAG: PAS domain S-box protein [Methylococcaceae bacterium]|jgi:PAS domain S-box-containing protein
MIKTMFSHSILQNLALVVDSVPDALFIHDHKGNFIEANQTACELVGYTKDKLLNMNLQELDLSLNLKIAQRKWQQIQTGEKPTNTSQFCHKNGTQLPVETHTGIIIDQAQRFYILIARNIADRLYQENALREQITLLNSILQTIPDVVFFKDTQGVYQFCNAACERVAGIPTADVLGKTDYDLFPPAMADYFVAFDHKVLTSNQTSVGEEWVALGENTGQFLMETIKTPLNNQNGQRIGILGVARDVTSNYKSKIVLAELTQQLQIALQISKMGVWQVDLKQDLVTTIQGGGPISGLPEDITPKNKNQFISLLHPDDRQQTEEKLHNCIVLGKPYKAEFRIILPDQSIRWVFAHGLCRYDSQGLPLSIIGVDLDITENQNLMVEKQRWTDAFTHCAHGIVIGDPSSQQIITCNPAFAQLLGYDSPKEMEGMPILSLYHEERRALIQNHINAADREGKTRFESVYRCKDDTCVEAQVELVSVKSQDNKILYRVATAQNITERNRSRAQLQQLNDELEQRVTERTDELASLNNSLEAFVYSVSHDLKTPLRGIEGYSRLLQKSHLEKLDKEGQLFLHNICEGVKRMNELIDDLLAYSRMGRRKLEDSLIDLRKLLEKVLAERAEQINHFAVQIDIELPEITLYADAEGLALILRNLIENALKFTSQQPEPHIIISAKQELHSLTLSIKDNGIGFDMKYSERIFEIFQRLHRLEDYPGTGIGLALVKTAMQRMNGKVWTESSPGQGATFYLWFNCPNRVNQ